MTSLQRSSQVPRVDSCTAPQVANWSSGVYRGKEVLLEAGASSDLRAAPRCEAVTLRRVGSGVTAWPFSFARDQQMRCIIMFKKGGRTPPLTVR